MDTSSTLTYIVMDPSSTLTYTYMDHHPPSLLHMALSSTFTYIDMVSLHPYYTNIDSSCLTYTNMDPSFLTYTNMDPSFLTYTDMDPSFLTYTNMDPSFLTYTDMDSSSTLTYTDMDSSSSLDYIDMATYNVTQFGLIKETFQKSSFESFWHSPLSSQRSFFTSLSRVVICANSCSVGSINGK